MCSRRWLALSANVLRCLDLIFWTVRTSEFDVTVVPSFCSLRRIWAFSIVCCMYGHTSGFEPAANAARHLCGGKRSYFSIA